MRRIRWGIVSVLVVVGAVCFWCVSAGLHWRRDAQSPLRDAASYREQSSVVDEVDLAVGGSRPGLDNPAFAGAHDSRLIASLSVIGVIVHGRAYAYSLKALSMPNDAGATPNVGELSRRHVVNQLLGTTAVSVTYCDGSTCARVFRMESQYEALPVGVSGQYRGEMVLQYAGQRYMQDSPQIPLQDTSFEITTWGDWVTRYPASHIYLGM